MNLKRMIMIVAGVALVGAAIAQPGQGRRGGFGPQFDPLSVAQRTDVGKEISITDDQKTKLTELADKAQQARQEAFTAARESAGDDRDAMMKAMQAAGEKLNADNAKALAGILSADQMKRINEIRVQLGGNNLITSDKDIQTALSITDDQKAKFKDLQARQRTAMQELFQKMQNGDIDQAAMRETMTKNQKVMSDEIGKILTDDQRSKYKDMGGKPFTATDPVRGPGGGRAGGGR